MNRSLSLRRADFQRAWDSGKSWSHPLIILRVSANGRASSRFGFVVGKKIGKATQRNRAKRLLREAVRRRIKMILPGWDIILIFRSDPDEAESQAIDAAVEDILKRAHLIRNP